MKNTIYFILTVYAVFLFTSCGGNSGKVKSSLPANDYLGNLPAILESYHKTDSIIKAEFDKNAKDIKSEKDIERFDKYKEERKAKSTENQQRRDDAIAKEKESLIGKQLPVESLDPRFEVLELKIKNIDSGGASIEGRIKIRETVKKVGLQFVINYNVIDTESNVIMDYGIIYVEDKDLRRYELSEGTELDIDSYLRITEDNAEDYSKFAKVIFIEKK